ncbi:hypothetical protein XHC_3395 [Xanthomonas hortorum pv. carotae str. M081]|nr:hypothetical protein XHC_3395 [Xanthomonas hortorum pv. carotae str. M081]
MRSIRRFLTMGKEITKRAIGVFQELLSAIDVISMYA